MSNDLFHLEWIHRLAGFNQLIIGYSGGLDSTVLLHALASESVLRNQLLAVHVHHGLSVQASNWQRHCQGFCEKLGIPFLAKTIEFNRSSNVEEAARIARYAFFSSLMKADDCLILAHHLDDQAETVLLHLFRGAGIEGLSGMRSFAPLACGTIARPLLSNSRHQLELYAKTHQLRWVEDESNLDVSYSRNFLRHEVIPLIRKKWPKVVNNLAHTASHCQQAQANLNELAALDYEKGGLSKNPLSIEPLKKLSVGRISNLLRVWLKNNAVQMPSTLTFGRIIHELIFAKQDAEPLVSWKNIQIRRYQDHLYLETKPQKRRGFCMDWLDFPQPLVMEEKPCIRAKKSKQGIALPDNAQIQVRFRQGGERMVWHGQTKHLKKLMQEWSIPPWLRDQIPLIYINNQLAVVVGYAISDLFFTKNSPVAWVLETC